MDSITDTITFKPIGVIRSEHVEARRTPIQALQRSIRPAG